MPPIFIAARSGAHVILQPTQKLKVVNPSGHQVADTWAFPIHKQQPTWMSMAQTRSRNMKLSLAIDDALLDTQREPVLVLREDTSGGVHDILFPPCDSWRYADVGMPEHASCGANLRRELAAFRTAQLGNVALTELESSIVRWGWTPEPLNLFMNVPWSGEKGELQVRKPACKAGDYVVFEALVPCLVVLSACPNDVMDTNGGQPESIAYELLS